MIRIVGISDGPAIPGGRVRVYNVAPDGTETEITEVCNIEISISPAEVIRARVETFLTATPSINAVGSIVVLCPKCRDEVFEVPDAESDQ